MSESESLQRSPEPQEKPKPNKIFVTNLEVDVTIAKLQSELWHKFQKYGKLDSVMAKKSFNNQYCFAFVEYKEGEDATLAVKQLNNTSLLGSRMKVELQDNARRRKGGSESCFVCGKIGHYARNCRQNKDRDSVSHSSDHHKKKSKYKRRHSSSDSSDSSKKKQKKRKHSKKIKKGKHKKERKVSSDSSD